MCQSSSGRIVIIEKREDLRFLPTPTPKKNGKDGYYKTCIEFKTIKVCINGEIDQLHELEDSLMSGCDSFQVDLRI